MGFFSCIRAGQEKILIRTSLGDIEVEIYSGLAPVTASNFLSLADAGGDRNPDGAGFAAFGKVSLNFDSF